MPNVVSTVSGREALINIEEGGYVGGFGYLRLGREGYIPDGSETDLRDGLDEKYPCFLRSTATGEIAIEADINRVDFEPFEAGIFLDDDTLLFVVSETEKPLFIPVQGVDLIYAIDLSILSDYQGRFSSPVTEIDQGEFFISLNQTIEELKKIEISLQKEIQTVGGELIG